MKTNEKDEKIILKTFHKTGKNLCKNMGTQL